MNKNLVEQLTFEEVKTILSGKLQYELEEVTETVSQWYTALGLRVLPFDHLINEKISEALCEVISERIVFEDPSPIDDSDFEAKVEEILAEVQLYEHREEIPDVDFRQYLKGLFTSTFSSIGQPIDEPYMGYRQWLQSYLDLAAELSEDPTYLTVDHRICDELMRRKISKVDYVETGLIEIEIMVDIDIFFDLMIRPLAESQVESLGLSPEEAAEELDITLETMKADLSAKLEVARKIMVERFMARVKRIYG